MSMENQGPVKECPIHKLYYKSDEECYVCKLESDVKQANEKIKKLDKLSSRRLEIIEDQQKRLREHVWQIDQLTKYRDALEKLLDERNRLLKLFECPIHGECVPYAIEEVECLRNTLLKISNLDFSGFSDAPFLKPKSGEDHYWTLMALNAIVKMAQDVLNTKTLAGHLKNEKET